LDIYYVIQNYSGGLDEIVKTVEPYLKMPLVQEGLRKIAGNSHRSIMSAQETSPIFMILRTPAHTLCQRDSFKNVRYLLQMLGLIYNFSREVSQHKKDAEEFAFDFNY
jgi:hypothetical protein